MHLRYPEIGEPDFRLTVDTQADFELISRILVDRSSFSWKSILNRPLFYEPSED
jgi:spore coat polysaccharide biosynthesis protein SpsF (cytidylyltransferase family)